MTQYQIYDACETRLLEPMPVYEANRPIGALRKYLADKNERVSIKISADRDVRFGVIPVNHGRRTWFKTIEVKA